MRKFEILDVTMMPGGAGPSRVFQVTYKAIVEKQWIEKVLHIVARNTIEARNKATKQFQVS